MRSLRLLPLILLVMTLMMSVTGCRHTPREVTACLDRAEDIMESRPDLALSILDSIDSTALTGRADRARYALLLSMALDKNCIDTTEFTILQPAIDYYEKHGTADQRLKTLYYKGRIYMNRGDDDAALTAFLQAARDSADCRDSLALARLYVAQGSMYYKIYWIDSYIRCNEKASKIYKDHNDTIHYINSNIRILTGAIQNGYIDKAKQIHEELRKYENKITTPEYLGLTLEYYYFTGNTQLLRQELKDIENDDSIHIPMNNRLDIVNIYDWTGENAQALRHLKKAEEDFNLGSYTREDSIKYYAVASSVYEHNGMDQDALRAYKNYMDVSTAQDTDIFNNGQLYSEERHENNVKMARKEHSYLKAIVIIYILLVTSLVIILIILNINRLNKNKKLLLSLEKKDISFQYTIMMLENQRLNDENILAQEKIDREEAIGLSLKYSLIQSNILISNLEKEKQNLLMMLETHKHITKPIRVVINRRIEIIDGYIKSIITGNPQYKKEMESLYHLITEDKASFVSYIQESYNHSHPTLIRLCREAGLTDREIAYVCLLALDLSNKEIAEYLELERIRQFASDIRKKLNIQKNQSTLNKFVKQVMQQDQPNVSN